MFTVQAGNCSMYCDQRILQMVLSYFPGFCKEIIPNSCWSICDLIWLKSIIYPLCNTYLLLMYVHTTKVWMTYIIYIRRLVLVSTDQAIPSCFYFRISWILMEQHFFYFFLYPWISAGPQKPQTLTASKTTLESGINVVPWINIAPWKI